MILFIVLASISSPESFAYFLSNAVPAKVPAPSTPPPMIESAVEAIPPPNPAPVIQDVRGILALVASRCAAPTAKARILFNAPYISLASKNSA